MKKSYKFKKLARQVFMLKSKITKLECELNTLRYTWRTK